MDAVGQQSGRQIKDIDKTLIPHTQLQFFVKHTDPLRHAGHNGTQIGEATLRFSHFIERSICQFHAISPKKLCSS
jgi:hypothetical protein